MKSRLSRGSASRQTCGEKKGLLRWDCFFCLRWGAQNGCYFSTHVRRMTLANQRGRTNCGCWGMGRWRPAEGRRRRRRSAFRAQINALRLNEQPSLSFCFCFLARMHMCKKKTRAHGLGLRVKQPVPDADKALFSWCDILQNKPMCCWGHVVRA